MAEVLGVNRLALYTDAQKPLSDQEIDKLRSALKRRGAREPLQYILGEVKFLDVTLKVDPRVLIPRPETEILADKIIKAIPQDSEKVFWDICAGSGAIGLAVKKARPRLKVTLADISPQALEVARENARLNGLEVEFLEGDFLAPFKGRKADYAASNPPYISEKEYLTLEPEVKNFEPVGALVSGGTGREFYERFNRDAPSYLNPEAIVWLELGPAGTEKIFENDSWSEVKMELDYSSLPRYLTMMRNPLNFK